MKGQARPRASSLALVQVDAAAAKPAEGAAPEMDKNIPLAALQDLTDMKLSSMMHAVLISENQTLKMWSGQPLALHHL